LDAIVANALQKQTQPAPAALPAIPQAPQTFTMPPLIDLVRAQYRGLSLSLSLSFRLVRSKRKSKGSNVRGLCIEQEEKQRQQCSVILLH
jgi:hypothetical protein